MEFEGDFGIAEVGDGAYVGVADTADRAIGAILDFEADFLVGFAEGHILKNEAVDFLDREEIVVARVVDDVALHADVLKHEVGHVETLYHLGRGGEDYVFQQLEVTVVAEGEIGCQEGYLVLH